MFRGGSVSEFGIDVASVFMVSVFLVVSGNGVWEEPKEISARGMVLLQGILQ